MQLGESFAEGLGGVVNRMRPVHLRATWLKRENIPGASILHLISDCVKIISSIMHVVTEIGAMLRNGTGWDEVQLHQRTRPMGGPLRTL